MARNRDVYRLYDHLVAIALGTAADDQDGAEYRAWFSGAMPSAWGREQKRSGQPGAARFAAARRIAQLAEKRGYALPLIPEPPAMRARRERRAAQEARNGVRSSSMADGGGAS